MVMNISPLRLGLGAVALLVIVWVIYSRGHAAGEAKAVDHGMRFVTLISNEQQACRADKAVLLSSIGASRQRELDQIEACEAIVAATGAARANMLAAQAQTKESLRRAKVDYYDKILALQREQDDWKTDPIPDAIVCGVFNSTDCAAPGVRDSGG